MTTRSTLYLDEERNVNNLDIEGPKPAHCCRHKTDILLRPWADKNVAKIKLVFVNEMKRKTESNRERIVQENLNLRITNMVKTNHCYKEPD